MMNLLHPADQLSWASEESLRWAVIDTNASLLAAGLLEVAAHDAAGSALLRATPGLTMAAGDAAWRAFLSMTEAEKNRWRREVR